MHIGTLILKQKLQQKIKQNNEKFTQNSKGFYLLPLQSRVLERNILYKSSDNLITLTMPKNKPHMFVND